jgi:hypothetical protein
MHDITKTSLSAKETFLIYYANVFLYANTNLREHILILGPHQNVKKNLT